MESFFKFTHLFIQVFNLMHADVATAGGLTFGEAEERLKKLRETRSPAIVNSLGGSGIPNLRASIGTGMCISYKYCKYINFSILTLMLVVLIHDFHPIK